MDNSAGKFSTDAETIFQQLSIEQDTLPPVQWSRGMLRLLSNGAGGLRPPPSGGFNPGKRGVSSPGRAYQHRNFQKFRIYISMSFRNTPHDLKYNPEEL